MDAAELADARSFSSCGEEHKYACETRFRIDWGRRHRDRSAVVEGAVCIPARCLIHAGSMYVRRKSSELGRVVRTWSARNGPHAARIRERFHESGSSRRLSYEARRLYPLKWNYGGFLHNVLISMFSNITDSPVVVRVVLLAEKRTNNFI